MSDLRAKGPIVEVKRMNAISFLRESLRNFKTVGTVTQSSPALCKGAIKQVDFVEARHLIELGAGDGVITKHILAAMHPEARLMAFEVNPLFCAQLRALDDERLVVVEDSAEHMKRHLRDNEFAEIDAVVSAIPFVNLPKALADSIVNLCRDVLRVGGPFSQVHYSLIRKKAYAAIFGNVKVDFIAMNVPPAFVLTSRKK